MRRSIVPTSTLIVGLVLAGCGSSDGGGTTPTTDSGAPADSTPTSDSATTDTAISDSPTTDSTPTDAPATDSTASDTPTDAPTDVATACTPTSTIRLKLNALGGTLPATTTVTPSVCGTGPITVDPTKRNDFAVPQLTNVFFTIDAGSTFWPTASVEWNRPAGSSGDEDINVLGKTALALPDYDATKAHVLVQLNAPATATTCDASAWVVTVPGHAEAKVQYTKDGSLTIDPTLTASVGTRGAVVIIQKIDPGIPVTLVATKTGCGADFKISPLTRTGNVPLVAGKLVSAVANLAVKP